MAKFKAGDRVKKIMNSRCHEEVVPVGTAGTIISSYYNSPPYAEDDVGCDWVVRYDNMPRTLRGDGGYAARSDWLAPLAPPAIDQWAQQKVNEIKKWKPDPSILNPQKVRQRAPNVYTTKPAPADYDE